MFDHGNGGLIADALNQAFATAWDNHVDVVFHGNQFAHRATVRGFNDLHRSFWQTCRSLWWRGTPYFDGEQEDLMPQSLEKAKTALKESGYNGEKVVIINPTDFPDIGPLGDVTYELLKSMGMNVEMAAMS